MSASSATVRGEQLLVGRHHGFPAASACLDQGPGRIDAADELDDDVDVGIARPAPLASAVIRSGAMLDRPRLVRVGDGHPGQLEPHAGAVGDVVGLAATGASTRAPPTLPQPRTATRTGACVGRARHVTPPTVPCAPGPRCDRHDAPRAPLRRPGGPGRRGSRGGPPPGPRPWRTNTTGGRGTLL